MMKKEIIVYISPSCMYCYGLKTFFKKQGIEFASKNIKDEKYAKELEQYDPQKAVPYIVIKSKNTEETIKGLNIKKIREILQI
ncbi:glutaredoxin family protein [Bacillus sp. SN10]|uniref:glutaredoxin family protein n=1 Tax=Bacillus sp. SN10 TaxID=2056493 RepID=UPI0012FF24FF|nr:glutaredoxin family protein [Bacillus sp. SN10]